MLYFYYYVLFLYGFEETKNKFLNYNFFMMKKLIYQFLPVVSGGFLPLIIVSCSQTNNQDNQINNKVIVEQEVQRIEEIKSSFNLKGNPIKTKAEIEKLNQTNILENIENWKPGLIENHPDDKFIYDVLAFNNGLNQTGDQQHYLSFQIKVTYQTDSQITNLIKINYQLQEDNPSKPDQPDLPLDQLLDPAGGTLINTNLKTNKYLHLLEQLNLFKNDTYLPNINNDLLENALNQNQKLKNLKLTIDNQSNTLEGKLVLNLTGHFQNQIELNEQIIITGFQTYSLTNAAQLQYYDFKINQKQWFDSKLPIDTTNDLVNQVKQISSNQWNAVLDDFKVVQLNSQSNLITNKKQLKDQGFTFDISSNYDVNKKEIDLKIITKFIHKKYQNNQWIDTNNVAIWNPALNKKAVVNLFKQTELEQFIVDQTNVNEQQLSLHFPSYYLAKDYFYQSINSKIISDQDLFENQYLEDETFKDFYFPNKKNLLISFKQDSISADDWNNHLSFAIALAMDENVSGFKQFEFNNLNKDINKILANQLEQNHVQIKPDSNVKKTIIKHLKSKHQDQVNQLFQNGGTISFNDFNANQVQQLKQPLLKYEANENGANWNKIEQQIAISIFNKPINLSTQQSFDFEASNTINYFSHLLWLNANDAFVIEEIQYQFDDNIPIKLTKPTNNFIKVELEAKTLISFAANQTKIIPTTFYFELHQSDWKIK